MSYLDRKPRKSCYELFAEAYNSTPYKINWNNKQFGKVWFSVNTNVPRGLVGEYCQIAMGIEGLIKGWKMDLSNFGLEGHFIDQGYVTYEQGNEIVKSLTEYYNQEEIYSNDSRISEKDINKYVKLNDLCWENPVTRQGKKVEFYDQQLEFLDQ